MLWRFDFVITMKRLLLTLVICLTLFFVNKREEEKIINLIHQCRRIVSICENCTSAVYHKRLNCTNNENCTSVGGASALFNSCFRRSAASKLWDPKEENPILSKIRITHLIIVEVTFSNRFNAQTWLSYPSPSSSHQADNFYWQLNNRLHFSVKGPGCQELASFRQAQKMPSILSSDAYLLICDKKRCFFRVLPKLQQKGSFYLVFT